jgi:hypothetical protein
MRKKAMSQLTPESLLTLLAEVEKEDPIEFADLPYEEADLRNLACLHVAEFLQSPEYSNMSVADREKVMAATMAKLILENLVLNARLLISKE